MSQCLEMESPAVEAGAGVGAVAAPQPQLADGESLRQALRACALTQADLARQAGVSPSALSQWFRRCYKGDNAALQARLAVWLQEAAPQPAAGQAPAVQPGPPGPPQGLPPEAQGPQWVDTPTGRAIVKTLDFARSRPCMAVIYGGAGVGKTTALRRYARQVQNVWIVTASPAISSMADVLRALCGVLGLVDAGWKNQAMTAGAVRQLKDTGALLIVDEAQHLSVPALEQLRYIYDQAGIGLALSGNEKVYSQLSGGHVRSASFAQLYSRLGRRLRVSAPQEQDIAAFLDAWGITGRAERTYAAQVAGLPGGLRGLSHMLQEARLAALGMGRPVDVALLRAAQADLAGAA